MPRVEIVVGDRESERLDGGAWEKVREPEGGNPVRLVVTWNGETGDVQLGVETVNGAVWSAQSWAERFGSVWMDYELEDLDALIRGLRRARRAVLRVRGE